MIDYLLKKEKEGLKNPQMIGGNVATFGTKDDVKKDFDYYSQLKPKVKNQVVHLSVSLKPGEHLDEEKKVEFSEKLLEKLNFKTDRVPYLIVEHHDKEYEHWHIVAGRIGDDGKTVKEWRIAEHAISTTKELEREFGLEQVEYQSKSQRQIKRSEYKLIERTEELSVMSEAKIFVDESLREKPTTKLFVESLQQNGFKVRPNISETTGKMNGFSFKKDEIIFKSSSLGKQYSFQNLQKNGLDYNQERDTNYLIEVKRNESAKKCLVEVGRNRTVETNESSVDTQSVESERTNSFSTGNTGVSNPELERTGQTKPFAERAKPIADEAESDVSKAVNESDSQSSLNERPDSPINGGTEAFSRTEPADPRFIDSAYRSFERSEQAGFEHYLNSQQIENGNQENEIQYFHQPDLLNAGNGRLDCFANLTAQFQLYQEEFFNGQPEENQISSQSIAAATIGTGQGTEDIQLRSDDFKSVNFQYFDSSPFDQMTAISASATQNSNELNTDVSSSEDYDDILDAEINFRVETPQIIELEEEVEEDEEEMEDEMDEEEELRPIISFLI